MRTQKDEGNCLSFSAMTVNGPDPTTAAAAAFFAPLRQICNKAHDPAGAVETATKAAVKSGRNRFGLFGAKKGAALFLRGAVQISALPS